MFLLSMVCLYWSYPEYKSPTKYIAHPMNASTNSSTISPTLEFWIMSLFTGYRSWINRSDLFFFRTINHWFEYGALNDSRIPIATFSFNNSMIFGICALNIGIGFSFHIMRLIVKITISSIYSRVNTSNLLRRKHKCFSMLHQHLSKFILFSR